MIYSWYTDYQDWSGVLCAYSDDAPGRPAFTAELLVGDTVVVNGSSTNQAIAKEAVEVLRQHSPTNWRHLPWYAGNPELSRVTKLPLRESK